MACITIMLLASWTFALAPAFAHEEDEGHKHHDETATASSARFPKAVLLPETEGPNPWSDKPVLNDPSRFQIAIVTDRTGGHRPGIWMKAVRRLNLLRPEFVVSVGDLIEGYTENTTEIESQWKEFLGFIDQMEMKFFFVAGNHDLTNPVMHKIWREKFGAQWYSFDYKGVHFVCLNSENPVNHLGDEQLKWLRGDLEANRDARWTLVFLHKPLWVYAEREILAGNSDPTNWKQVEAMLGQRPHTVFAGHVHHYAQYDRNGMKYYHLATTGGGSQLRGVPYGEFDHITWLTMERQGPYITHLMLDGILAPEVVTEKKIAKFREFLAKSQVEIAPILVRDQKGFSQGEIHVRLANGFDHEVSIEGEFAGLPLRGLTVDPEKIRLSAAPGEDAQLSVGIRFSKPIEFVHLAETTFTARIWSQDGKIPLSAEQTIPVVIDRAYGIASRSEAPTLDGDLSEWDSLPFASEEHPVVLSGGDDWTGPADAAVEFQVVHHGEYLYIAAKVLDDSVIPDGDRLEFILDARPIAQRTADPRLRGGSMRIAVAPGTEGEVKVTGYRKTEGVAQVKSSIRSQGEGYTVELAIPLGLLKQYQGGSWQGFQLNCLIVDQDEQGGSKSRLAWRGTARSNSVNRNFGHFVREK